VAQAVSIFKNIVTVARRPVHEYERGTTSFRILHDDAVGSTTECLVINIGGQEQEIYLYFMNAVDEVEDAGLYAASLPWRSVEYDAESDSVVQELAKQMLDASRQGGIGTAQLGVMEDHSPVPAMGITERAFWLHFERVTAREEQARDERVSEDRPKAADAPSLTEAAPGE
jgi:hypothetical protein